MFEDEIGSQPVQPQDSEPYRFRIGENVGGWDLVRAYSGRVGWGRPRASRTQSGCRLKYCRRGQDRRRSQREVRMMEQAKSAYGITSWLQRDTSHPPPGSVGPCLLRHPVPRASNALESSAKSVWVFMISTALVSSTGI